MQVDPLQERRVNAVILSEAKNLGFRFELLAAAEERSGREREQLLEGKWSLTLITALITATPFVIF